MTMTSSRTRMTDAEWLQHKPYIRRMIIDENISQDEARRRLKDEGVLVTKAQLEYKLKIWGFRKKTPKKTSHTIWQFIGHRVEKRKQQHKASDVLLNGRLVDPAKVRKEVNRHQPTSLVRYRQAAMSPKTPKSPKVVIFTPASTPTQSLWPSCLPWFQLQQRLSYVLGFSKPSVAFGNSPAKVANETESTFLHSISPSRYSWSVYGSCSIADGLKLTMPEAHSHEHVSRTRLLLSGSAADITTECLEIAFYQISNKLGVLGEYEEWDSIVELLETSGVMKRPLQLGKMVDTTLYSVAETLFQQAFKTLMDDFETKLESCDCRGDGDRECLGDWVTENLEIISWLLSSGQDPNTPLNLGRTGRLTPLQVAVKMDCPRLISLLLDAQSDPTLVYDDTDPPIMRLLRQTYPSCNNKIRLVKRFLKDNASVRFFQDQRPGSLLTAAVQGLQDEDDDTLNLELLDILMDNRAEICLAYQTHSPLDWATQTCSILGYAALIVTESVAMSCLSYLFERAQQSEPFLSMARFVTTDVIFLAAFRGHNKVIELLRQLDVDFTVRGHRGVTALHVAAYFGRLEICQTLLELGVPVDGHLNSQYLPSPLHLAASRNKFEIIQLLHSHGAEPTKCITWTERRRWKEVLGYGKKKAGASPVGVVIINCHHQASEFLAQQGVTFPPWAAYYTASRPNPHPRAVKLALKMGADPNWRSEHGFSAFQRVLRQPKSSESLAHNVEIAMMLLDAGAVVTVEDVTEAILLNESVLVSRLLEINCFGMNQKDEFMLVLEAAIATGNHHMVAQIFARVPDAYDAGVLCSSVFFEDHGSKTVERLLDNRRQDGEVSPLESLSIGIAAWRNRADLLDLLLAKFTKPSPATLSKIIITGLGPKKVCRGWLDGAVSNTELQKARKQKRLFWRDEAGFLGSPLTLALESENSLSRLLGHGFLPDRLTMSIAAGLNDHSAVRKLARYPMVHPGFEEYRGPLAWTVRRNNADIVKHLLNGNHSINEDNSLVLRGRSPLQMAVEFGHLDLMNLLLDAGADVNTPAARARGATALQLAAIKGYLGVAKMLVDLGADVNASGATDEGGRTALEGAAEHGRIDTIQYLLIQGVETNDKGRLSYLRAIRYAELEGHMVAAKLMKKWREWTVKDAALWEKLKSLPKDECEWFTDEDFEDQSDSESGLERHSPGKVNEGDETQDLIFDDALAVEAHTHGVSVTANPAGGIFSELEDLEMMTSDAFAFWPGL